MWFAAGWCAVGPVLGVVLRSSSAGLWCGWWPGGCVVPLLFCFAAGACGVDVYVCGVGCLWCVVLCGFGVAVGLLCPVCFRCCFSCLPVVCRFLVLCVCLRLLCLTSCA